MIGSCQDQLLSALGNLANMDNRRSLNWKLSGRGRAQMEGGLCVSYTVELRKSANWSCFFTVIIESELLIRQICPFFTFASLGITILMIEVEG